MIGPAWHLPDKTGISLFMLGAVLGLLFFVAMFLQDTEALALSASVSGDESLRSLSCPEILTYDEVGTVRAKLHNRTEKELYRTVRAHFSRGFILLENQFTDHYTMQPGETIPLSWEVLPSDAAWGYVSLAKVHVLRKSPYPSYVGTCGVIWLDLPYVQGWHLVSAAWGLSLGLMGTGLFRFRQANLPLIGKKRKLYKNLVVVMATVLLAMCTLFFELWYLEVAFFIFTLILVAETAVAISRI